MDYFTVKNQKGMNNAYVTTSLGATLTSASTLQKKASAYPLILWQTTDYIIS